jgi:hypothetical protein
MDDLKNFNFFRSYYEAACELPDDQRLAFYDAILQYVFSGEIPELSGAVKALFLLIKPTLDKSKARSMAGAKGGSSNPEAVEMNDKQTASKIEANEKQSEIKREISPPKDKDKEEDKEKDKEKAKAKTKDLAQPSVAPSPEEPPLKPAKARRAGPPEYSEVFLRFWEVYPKRVDKERAFEVWNRIRAPDHERVITAARNYAAAMRSSMTEPEFIRHPKTFLNKGGWEDWVTGPPGADNGGVSDAQRQAIIAKYTDEEGQRDDRAILRELTALERGQAVESG